MQANLLIDRIIDLCSQQPDGIYKADWAKFQRDSGGYTINSLINYQNAKEVGMAYNAGIYHIWIPDAKQGAVDAS